MTPAFDTPGAAPPALAPVIDRVALADPVFISDLHLSAAQPRTLARFEHFARTAARRHRELVLLGDLFDAWAGDDALDDPGDAVARAVTAALAEFTGAGARLVVMRGNRDLLLGGEFARRTGATLLADAVIARIGERPALLAHGDAYCTRDEAYQRVRAQTRDPDFQRRFLAQPLAARRAFIAQARAQSEQYKQMSAGGIMDVTPAAIDAALREAAVALMIHGHTHRPARHEFTLGAVAAQRIVLPDWDFDATPARGGYLRFAQGEPRAEALP
jgi:UDP-2,3-diacylglucosamine hydrolase